MLEVGQGSAQNAMNCMVLCVTAGAEQRPTAISLPHAVGVVTRDSDRLSCPLLSTFKFRRVQRSLIVDHGAIDEFARFRGPEPQD